MSQASDSPVEQFNQEVRENIRRLKDESSLKEMGSRFVMATQPYKYSYNFSWMGRPIIQFPQDMIAMQELLWNVQPDLVIETGIAHGGSLIFSASMLELNAVAGGPSGAQVLGIDIDIRPHNREAIEKHPLYKRISMLQGSSVASDVVTEVTRRAADKCSVLVILDSNHTHDHVLAELNAYGPLVTPGSYCVVFDTIVEDLPSSAFLDRPWGPGNSPKSAVHKYLESHPEFRADFSIDAKLLISVAPGGYLRRLHPSEM